MEEDNFDYPGPEISKQKSKAKKITQQIALSTKKRMTKARGYVQAKYQQTKNQAKKTRHNVGEKVKKPFNVVKDAIKTREDEVRFYFNEYMHTGNIHYKHDPTTTFDYLQTQRNYLQAQTPQAGDHISRGYYGQTLSHLGIQIKSAFADNGWYYSFMEFVPENTQIKKVLVLWHGIGSWCGDLCHIKKITQQGIYVVAVDLLGHGASNADAQPQKIITPKGHITSFTEWTEQIAHSTITIQEIIYKNLNVEVVMGGISLSGMLTTRAFIDYKDRLPKRALLISPGYAAAGGLWLGNVPILRRWKGLVNFSKRYIPSFNRNSPFYIGEVLRIIKNANFSKNLHYNNLYTGHMTPEHEEYVEQYYQQLNLDQKYVTTEVTDKLYKEISRVSLALEKFIKKGKIRDSNFFFITTGKSKLDDKIICKHLIQQYIKRLRTHGNNITHVNLDEVEDHEPIFNYGRVQNRPQDQDIMKFIADYVLDNDLLL